MQENQQQIPEGWECKVLTQLADYINGYGFKPEDWSKEGLPIIRIEQLKNPDSDYDYCNITVDEKYIIENGDLIFSWSASLFLKIWDRQRSILNQHLFKVLPFQNIDKVFLKYLLDNSIEDLAKNAQGSTMQHITRKELHLFSRKLPKSKAEQTQIAAILSKVDEAITQTEQLIAKYTRIKTGLMQDLLTKGIDQYGNIRSEQTHEFKDSPLGRIPEEWECEMLGNIYDLKTGITPLRSNPSYFADEGFNWVKTLDLNEGNLFESEEKITEYALSKTAIKLRAVGTILIAMYGGWQQIGRTAILNTVATTNQAITALINPKENIDASFLQMFLQQNRYRWKQYAVSTRKDPNITKNDIAKFYILYPKNENEQKLIAKKILITKDIAEWYIRNLSKLQSLKKGLMQDLLSGKVRVSVNG